MTDEKPNGRELELGKSAGNLVFSIAASSGATGKEQTAYSQAIAGLFAQYREELFTQLDALSRSWVEQVETLEGNRPEWRNVDATQSPNGGLAKAANELRDRLADLRNGRSKP